ncbi:UNVERIFIED_CONTAM: hypothetical protein HDU68_003683, partial [Siphonaria sp. JEL0065]
PLNSFNVEERGVGINLKDKLAFTARQVSDALSTILNAKRGDKEAGHGFSLDNVDKLKVIARLNAEASLLLGANTIETVARVGAWHLIPADVGFSTWEAFGLEKGSGSIVFAVVFGFIGLLFVWRHAKD